MLLFSFHIHIAWLWINNWRDNILRPFYIFLWNQILKKQNKTGSERGGRWGPGRISQWNVNRFVLGNLFFRKKETHFYLTTSYSWMTLMLQWEGRRCGGVSALPEKKGEALGFFENWKTEFAQSNLNYPHFPEQRENIFQFFVNACRKKDENRRKGKAGKCDLR